MSVSLTKPQVGSTDWGDSVNQNWQDIEDAFKGVKTVGPLKMDDGTGMYLRIPRLTTAERDALDGEDGMLIFNTSANRFECYLSGAWGEFPGTTPPASLVRTYTQASHGFVTGNVIYRRSDGTWAKAIASDAASAESVGVVESVNGDNFTIALLGEITTLSDLSPGTVYFLSDSTAGDYTSDEPLVSKPVFIAVTSTTALVLQMRGVRRTDAPSAPEVEFDPVTDPYAMILA